MSADLAEGGILVLVMQEDDGWSGGSPNLGIDFVVWGQTRDEIVATIDALLAPLVQRGLRYRYLGQRMQS
ncbi:MAG: hypothetical protein AB7O98_09765 [Hyphomonadaceae bacterium]